MDNNTNVSIETLIEDAKNAEQAIKDAQVNYENKLHAIVAANGSSTFYHNNQWFQIRTRKDGETTVTYLCQLKAEPKTWLKGRPKGSVTKKKAASLSTVGEENNESHDTVPETFEIVNGESTTIID